MKSKLVLLIAVTLVTLGAYIVLDTRWGVHIVLDVVSEIGSPKEVQTAAAEGPLELTAQLSPVEKIQVPAAIQQPSGIKHRNGKVYIATDQAEIFQLDNHFKNLLGPSELLGGPLLFKQGALEGIEVSGDTLYGIGEFGSMRTWQESSPQTWTRTPDSKLPASIAETEFSGITDTPDGRFATSEEHQAIIHLEDGSTQELSVDTFLKDNADLGGLVFSGIAYDHGYFYVLSESHTSILVVDAASFRVESVFGIEPCAAADLSIHQGKAYIVIDHNYDQQTQPIHVYDLDAAMQASSLE